jgi:ADP-ribose pyrophosphatase YjhB (NUDIX family)
MIKMVQKAGAIVLSAKNKGNIVLIYRISLNDWSFPKGHVEEGESYTQTMTREIKEETGLDVKIIKGLPDNLYSNEDEGKISTKMFLVASEDDSKIKPEFEKDKVEWISIEKVSEKLSYDNLKKYFNLVLPEIKNAIM